MHVKTILTYRGPQKTAPDFPFKLYQMFVILLNMVTLFQCEWWMSPLALWEVAWILSQKTFDMISSFGTENSGRVASFWSS